MCYFQYSLISTQEVTMECLSFFWRGNRCKIGELYTEVKTRWNILQQIIGLPSALSRKLYSFQQLSECSSVWAWGSRRCQCFGDSSKISMFSKQTIGIIQLVEIVAHLWKELDQCNRTQSKFSPVTFAQEINFTNIFSCQSILGEKESPLPTSTKPCGQRGWQGKMFTTSAGHGQRPMISQLQQSRGLALSQPVNSPGSPNC